MRRDCRTPRQNQWIVLKALDMLAEGMTLREISWEYSIKWATFENLVKRYRVRWGFRTTCQMVAAHVLAKEQKKRP